MTQNKNEKPKDECCENCGSVKVLLTEELNTKPRCGDCGTPRK